MAHPTVRVSIKNYHLPLLDEYAQELGIEPDYTEIINALLLEFKRDRLRACSCSTPPPSPVAPPDAPSPNGGIDDDLFNQLHDIIQSA